MRIRLGSWWQCGLIGALGLSALTLMNVLERIDEVAEKFDSADALSFAAMIVGVGFVCGVVGWSGRVLYRHLGIAGSTLAGVLVGTVYFGMVMLLVEPELLGVKFRTGGLPMLIFGGIIGATIGASVGIGLHLGRSKPRPVRRRVRRARPPEQRTDPDAGKPLADGISCALCGAPVADTVNGATLCAPCGQKLS